MPAPFLSLTSRKSRIAWPSRALIASTFFLLSVGCSTHTGAEASKSNAITLKGSYVWGPEESADLVKLASSNATFEDLYFEDKLMIAAQVTSVRDQSGARHVLFQLAPVRGIDPLLDAMRGHSEFHLTNKTISLTDRFRKFPFKPGHIVELSFGEGDQLTAVSLTTYEVGPKMLGGRRLEGPAFTYDPAVDKIVHGYHSKDLIPRGFVEQAYRDEEGLWTLSRPGLFKKASVAPFKLDVDHAFLGNVRFLPMKVEDILREGHAAQQRELRDQVAYLRKEGDSPEHLQSVERELAMSEQKRFFCDSLVYSVGKTCIMSQEKGPGESNLNWLLKNKTQ